MKSIIFNTEMVKAILDGRKKQIRRVIELPHNDFRFDSFDDKNDDFAIAYFYDKKNDEYLKIDNKIDIYDILYVKETFLRGHIESGYDTPHEDKYGVFNYDKGKVIYKADHIDNIRFNNLHKKDKEDRPKWTPSILMKKEYARIFLKIINVRVERLNDITAIDMDSNMGTISPIISKLIAIDDYIELQNKYKKYWNSTAKDGYKWEDNPYVFVYEFERVKNERV